MLSWPAFFVDMSSLMQGIANSSPVHAKKIDGILKNLFALNNIIFTLGDIRKPIENANHS